MLRSGDAIRIIAPSGAFDREAFSSGVEILEGVGVKPRIDERIFNTHRYLAGTDEQRLSVVRDALSDGDARALWIARGGYGATRIASQVDAQPIDGRPLIGFSDTTALHSVWHGAGVRSVHGPNVTTLRTWSEDALAALWAMLFEGQGPELTGDVWVDGPPAEGPLVGGNLTVLAAMAGTPLALDAKGSVILLEDVGEVPYRLDRALTQLRHSGFFEGAVGVAVGQLTGCERDDRDYSSREVVADCLRPLGVPVVGGLPLGHEPSSWAVGLGVPTQLDGGLLKQTL